MTSALAKDTYRAGASRFNLFRLLRALLLATALWGGVSLAQNPDYYGLFPTTIHVDVDGVHGGLVLLDSSNNSTVSLKVRAPEQSWHSLQVNSFRAYVDMSSYLQP